MDRDWEEGEVEGNVKCEESNFGDTHRQNVIEGGKSDGSVERMAFTSKDGSETVSIRRELAVRLATTVVLTFADDEGRNIDRLNPHTLPSQNSYISHTLSRRF